MKYDDATQKDKILPNLKKGDKVNINFQPNEKETSPPKHYTIETLNNYLKNPFREEKNAIEDTVGVDDAEEYRAMFEGVELGTEATRSGIIENARKSGYIQLKKDVYTILPDGIYMIESLSRMNICMDKFKTSEMGKALKSVFRGEMSIDQSIDIAKEEISKYFSPSSEISLEDDTDMGFFGDYIGKCPLCGNEVKRGKFGYGCMGYKEGCAFRVNSFICGRVISKRNVALMLESGKTSLIRGFVSRKSGKSFDAYLKLEDGKAVFEFN